jgi:type IV pilus biogenesis protein CpaD/CtpE
VRELVRGGLAATLIALCGCDAKDNYLDPYQKPYAWYPTGAPTANLAAQVANPHDLAVGRGTADGDAKQTGLAIERVWQDHPKPIVGAGGSAAGAGASAAPIGGTGGSN